MPTDARLTPSIGTSSFKAASCYTLRSGLHTAGVAIRDKPHWQRKSDITVKGEFDLSTGPTVYGNVDAATGKEFTFKIVSGESDLALYLRAMSADDRDQWVRALRRAGCALAAADDDDRSSSPPAAP